MMIFWGGGVKIIFLSLYTEYLWVEYAYITTHNEMLQFPRPFSLHNSLDILIFTFWLNYIAVLPLSNQKGPNLVYYNSTFHKNHHHLIEWTTYTLYYNENTTSNIKTDTLPPTLCESNVVMGRLVKLCVVSICTLSNKTREKVEKMANEQNVELHGPRSRHHWGLHTPWDSHSTGKIVTKPAMELTTGRLWRAIEKQPQLSRFSKFGLADWRLVMGFGISTPNNPYFYGLCRFQFFHVGCQKKGLRLQ